MIADLFSVPKATFFTIRKQQTLNFSYHESSRWQFSSENQRGLKAFRTNNLPKRSVGCPCRSGSIVTKIAFNVSCLTTFVTAVISCKGFYRLHVFLSFPKFDHLLFLCGCFRIGVEITSISCNCKRQSWANHSSKYFIFVCVLSRTPFWLASLLSILLLIASSSAVCVC